MSLPARLAVVLLLCTWPYVVSAQQPPAPASPPAGSHGDHDHDTHDHAGHDHAGHDHPGAGLPPHIPPLTDADRAAAFPDLHAHAGHDGGIHTFVLVDQAEWRRGGGVSRLAVKVRGWSGGDLNRFWFRIDGDRQGGEVDHAGVHGLYGRPVAPWWDLVIGVRQDIRPGSPQTWAAVGLQGIAPYWFDVAATAYLSTEGRTQVRLEGEYDLLLTNRLILQPHLDADFYGRSDAGRGVGAGLSAADWGLRLRYEIRRELAPYAGVLWRRTFFGTRDLAAAAGEPTGGAEVAMGVRFWF